MSDFLVQQLSSLERSHNHLTQNRLLFLEIGELLLEVGVFFLLRDHPELEVAIKGLDERSGSFSNFLVNIADLSLHGV